MSYVNVLEARIMNGISEKLYVEATVTDQIIEPFTRVNVMSVDIQTDTIDTPFKQFDVISYEDFNKRLWNFRQSYERSYEDRFPNTQIQLNIKSVAEETD